MRNRMKEIKLYLALWYYTRKNIIKKWIHKWIRNIKIWVLGHIIKIGDNVIMWISKKLDTIDDIMLKVVNGD